ncbi:phosphate ABC transporter permease PstA [Luteithermobacter gelatinilyticus]|uniref:phosphate ABC transporter permease PstA n=1 Tax=Luteithermobacter gelatinilyticus TaxID=2582913 RepID=UPI001AEFE8F8|nr:phosphate ABC transporter permease PstA [Luteithermobacter gelatinilyticus]|tara:strand:+ start:2247 stop:3584 length:1338 start_codon:yes stop_codon:yes gene_type:complete
MTDLPKPNSPDIFNEPTAWKTEAMKQRVARRYRKEKIFKALGLAGLLSASLALAVLLGSVLSLGWSGFIETRIKLDIYMDPAIIGDINSSSGAEQVQMIQRADYAALLRESLRQKFPDVKQRGDVFALIRLVSTGARDEIRQRLLDNPSLMGQTVSMTLLASSSVDMFFKGKIRRDVPQNERKLSDKQIAWIDHLDAEGRISRGINWQFLSSGDSREPELAGIWGAVVGSFYTLLVCFLVAFPVGVASAIYLEEFAPKNRWTDLIEVNINNLAAVPSIVFGLLGLAIFLNVFNLPRSAPVVGGLTLALMTLPTIIIAARAAIRAVPPSIRDAAIGLGASPVQASFHHVLPLSMPGILTGTIIGMAQALGETAPLLMIGMVAFIVDIPQGITEAATALPVQIFLWADSPERGFLEKTAAAIIILLGFLIIMNGLAIWLRQKFEKRW